MKPWDAFFRVRDSKMVGRDETIFGKADSGRKPAVAGFGAAAAEAETNEDFLSLDSKSWINADSYLSFFEANNNNNNNDEFFSHFEEMKLSKCCHVAL